MTIALNRPELLKNQAYINGRWVAAADGGVIVVTDPATGEVVGQVPALSPLDAQNAITAAQAAFGGWAQRTAGERSAILRRWASLMRDNAEDLAMIMTREQGKPLAEARGEITYAASFFDWFAEEARRVYGDIIPTIAPDRRLLALKQPLGVVGAITPWNFPSAMLTRKAAPALAVGCTFVGRPASATPLSALALAVLAEEAGVPGGVFNVITGPAAPLGAVLTGDARVRKFTFTGSTEVGRALLADCASTIKKVSLELGGNAPFLVFDDADIEAATDGAIASKYRNAGQTCVCANRFYVQDGVYDAFVARLAQKVAALKVGPGMEAGVDVGPLIDAAAVAKVEEHIADALAQGGRLVTGGTRHALGGNFFQPTIIAQATHAMQVAREETFGPLAPIIRFTTEAEAIALANDSDFGLAAYFYARDMGRVWRVAEALESGMVAVNTGLMSTEVAPFGGVKQSGLGREGSKYGLEEFMAIKYVCLGGLS